MELVIIFLVCSIIYFMPWLVAWTRNHPQVLAIFVLNLLLGWTLIGWAGSMVWACVNSRPQRHRRDYE